jgi:hypothetical protein
MIANDIAANVIRWAASGDRVFAGRVSGRDHRIAEVITRLGAENRFQAGFRAARRGPF